MGEYMTDCDSCGNAILTSSRVLDRHSHGFVIPTNNERELERRDYVLCTECIRKIVDFIDGCDESETRADMVELEYTAYGIQDARRHLENIEEELMKLSRNELE